MASGYLTWLLDQSAWDAVLDANGNIAVASEPYRTGQDVASQLRTFLRECWYDTSQGVPYWQKILGGAPPASLVKSYLERQALLVPGVVAAVATVPAVTSSRRLKPSITVTTSDGNTITVG